MRDVPTALAFARRLARAILGMPDYDVYLAHQRTHHPDAPVLERGAFVRARQERRYAARGGPSRCC